MKTSTLVATAAALTGFATGWLLKPSAPPETTGDAGPESRSGKALATASGKSAEREERPLILKARGTDGDLKCILRGIAEDMPLKVAAVAAATTPAERRLALEELHYLLNDNLEVITAPPQPPV